MSSSAYEDLGCPRIANQDSLSRARPVIMTRGDRCEVQLPQGVAKSCISKRRFGTYREISAAGKFCLKTVAPLPISQTVQIETHTSVGKFEDLGCPPTPNADPASRTIPANVIPSEWCAQRLVGASKFSIRQPMSAFVVFTTALPPTTDINRDGRLRPLLTLNGHGVRA